MIKIKFIKHKDLKLIDLNKIVKFKKTFWKFKILSQKKFLEKNSMPEDIHLLLFRDKELVGYTFLNFRKINIRNKKIIAIVVDNVLVKKKLRGKLGVKLIKIINRKIKKLKKIGILICNKKLVNFYKFFKWEIIEKKKIITFPRTSLNIMVFNYNYKMKLTKIYFTN